MKSNQSILKEINPEYLLEGLMLKLKLQFLGHLMWRADSLEKTLILGKIEDRRIRGRQWVRWLDGITDSMGMSLSKLQEMMKDRKAWRTTVHGVTKSRIWLSNWTTPVPGAQWLRICLPVQETWVNPWVGKIPWRRKWQPTPVFLPGKSHGQRSLEGCSQ